MTAYSVSELVGSWMKDEIARHPAALGAEYGWEATMSTSKGPQGSVVHWTLLLTCPSPFLGKDALACDVRVIASVPSEKGVRSFARGGVSKLREQYDRLKAEARAGGEGKAFLGAAAKGRLN